MKETAAAVSAVTTWRPELVWLALSAKMVSRLLVCLSRNDGVFTKIPVQTAEQMSFEVQLLPLDSHSRLLWMPENECGNSMHKADVFSSPLEFFSFF